jgi:hypothetical protein
VTARPSAWWQETFVRGDEARIVDAFCGWLEQDGWEVTRESAFCDVTATRGTELLFAEAKGRTAAVGLDVDTAYGQLLRRMPLEADNARFALVVPVEALQAALRVPRRVRELLRLDVYSVAEDGAVSVADF